MSDKAEQLIEKVVGEGKSKGKIDIDDLDDYLEQMSIDFSNAASYGPYSGRLDDPKAQKVLDDLNSSLRDAKKSADKIDILANKLMKMI